MHSATQLIETATNLFRTETLVSIEALHKALGPMSPRELYAVCMWLLEQGYTDTFVRLFQEAAG